MCVCAWVSPPARTANWLCYSYRRRFDLRWLMSCRDFTHSSLNRWSLMWLYDRGVRTQYSLFCDWYYAKHGQGPTAVARFSGSEFRFANDDKFIFRESVPHLKSITIKSCAYYPLSLAANWFCLWPFQCHCWSFCCWLHLTADSAFSKDRLSGH